MTTPTTTKNRAALNSFLIVVSEVAFTNLPQMRWEAYKSIFGSRHVSKCFPMDRTFSSNRRPAGFRSVRVEGDAELLASANSGLFLPRAQEPEQHE